MHRKQILELQTSVGITITELEDIKEKIIDLYKGLIRDYKSNLPAVDVHVMRQGPVLTQEQKIELCKAVTGEEIYKGLCDIGEDKAPGVDGYNACFYKKAWGAIKEDIIQAVQQFFQSGKLLKSFNCTTVTLIPKVTNQIIVKEYMPIACCTVVYKLTTKVLGARMQDVMASVISQAQSGFIPSRKIADNTFLAKELVKECVHAVNYSILVHGEPAPPFDAKKGLRQGDPKSPYLFAIAMEYLSRLLGGLRSNKGFKYHPKCSKLGVTYMCFADDLLLFARGDLSYIKALYQCFMVFSGTFGLQENMSKSCVYFGGVASVDRQNKLQQLGFSEGELPFKYLGIPLTTGKLSLVQWIPLIEKIVARITSWIVLKHIDAYCRSYVWSGANAITKKALVVWDRVSLPKTGGGLKLIDIYLQNKVVLIKTCWDLANKQDKLWIRWIHAFYVKGKEFFHALVQKHALWMVRKLFEMRDTLQQIQIQPVTSHSIIKQIYLQLLGDRPKIPWKCLVFHNSTRPKAQFTMWLQIQGRLLTADRLNSWGIDVDLTYVLCGTQQESTDHLYIQRTFFLASMAQDHNVDKAVSL
ncbi:uncharacterized protein LOC132620187 [Lycium barbarum]|uniref:uncharacterized protein LOC132620187 n=1 Tax=Lycium barbarum TaxID=112863 RepID=UPI00293E3D79|nr:uncharacterized protein LOC132620187 [Lycium barbarum]